MTVKKKHKLSIQFSLNGFSFLVFATKSRRLVKEKEVKHTASEDFYDWLRVKLAGEDDFRKQYETVSLLYTPEKYTVLPNELSKKEQERELFSVAFPLLNEEILFSEKLAQQTLLSAIPKNVKELIEHYFPKAKWQSTPAFLIRQMENLKKWDIGVLLLNNKIYLAIHKDEKLQLCNSFSFTTKDDLLYYLLYAFDNLNIPVAESCIQLYGNQNYVKLLASELQRYHADIVLPPQTLSSGTKTQFSNLLLLNI